ncbi:PrsW family intramembrane metalloprotease [Candidatus Sumerlaeota bacterium]|nr:PrsW family intramembrane metalloprotease [Candidatus Sumerlaeota bacterium]
MDPQQLMTVALQLAVTLIAVAVPMSFYALLIWTFDRFEREPAWRLIAAFVWGAIPAVAGSIIFTEILYTPLRFTLGAEDDAQFLIRVAMAPAVEEILKAGAVWMMYRLHPLEFDGWIDGLVYGAMAGFGFGFVENVGYLMSAHTYDSWLSIYLLRVITFGFMHGFYTALTGVGFGVARWERDPARRGSAIFGCLILAIMAHSIHNIGCELSGGAGKSVAILNYGLMLFVMAVLYVASTQRARRTLRKYLADEAPEVLSQREYKSVCCSRFGGMNIFHPHWRKRRRLVQLCAELAQKKRQRARMGDESGNDAEIERLRNELRQWPHR